MSFFFGDMGSVKKAVEENIERLSSNTNENGKIALFDIKGNPTDDDTILGNRLEIFNQFKKMVEAYYLISTRTSIDDFNDRNVMVLVVESSRYRKFVDMFYVKFDDVYERFDIIKELQKNLADGEQIKCDSGCTLQELAEKTVQELKEIKDSLDVYFLEAHKCATTSRLMCMIIGFVEFGEDFWDNPDIFEDGYSECLDQMQREYEIFKNKLVHNESHKLSEMIT